MMKLLTVLAVTLFCAASAEPFSAALFAQKLAPLLSESVELRQLDSCQQCQQLVGHVDDVMESKDFHKAARNLINDFCAEQQLPEFDKIMCQITFNAFIPRTLRSMKAQFLTPYCTKSTCNPDTILKFSLCSIFQSIKNQVDDMTDLFSNLCTDLPKPAQVTECQKLVAKYVPQVQSFLDKVVGFVIKLFKCTSTEGGVHTQVSTDSNIKCEACNDGIKLLNDLLESPLVKGSLTKLLQGLCLELPAEFVTGCVETVQTTMDDVVKFITDMTDHICPDLVKCASAGFQLATTSESKTCNGLQGIYNSVPNFIMGLAPVCAVFKNTTQRDNCQALFAKEQQAVTQFGQKVLAWTAAHLAIIPECHLGPQGKVEAPQANAVALKTPQDIRAQWIAKLQSRRNRMSPSMLYRMRMMQKQAVAANIPKTHIAHFDNIECQACDDAVGFLNYLLGSPFVEGSLKILLGKLCSELPAEYASGCTQTVAGSLDQIVHFIGDMDGHICTDALSCPAKSAMDLIHPLTTSTNDVCDALQKIYNYVPQMTTQLEGVCDVIPSQYSAGCHSFFKTDSAAVTHMAQEVVQWLANEIPLADCHVGQQKSQ